MVPITLSGLHPAPLCPSQLWGDAPSPQHCSFSGRHGGGGRQRMTLLSCVCWVRVAALQVRVRPSLHPHRESLVTNVAPFPSPHCPWFLLCAAPCAPWRGVAPIPKHWRGCIPQIRSACVHPQPPVLPQFLLPEAVLGCCVVEGRAVPGDSQASLMVSPPPKPGAALHCSMVQ